MFNTTQNVIVNAQEVTRLRKAGQLNEALALVNVLLTKEPDNLYNRRAAGWVYAALIKSRCNTVSELNDYLAMIAHLTLDIQELIFWEQLCWQVAKLFFRLDNSTTGTCWTIFHELWSTMPHHPSLGNSTLLKAILKHQTEIPSLVFCRFFDTFNHFQIQDYQPEIMANGKAMPALVERYYIGIAKNWCTLIEKEKSLDLPYDLISFLENLDRVSEQQSNMVYLIYYRAILRLNLGKFEEAKKIIIPFAQKKQTDFWVWDLLAELHPTNIDMQFACLAKALLCKASPDFLVKVRQKMIEMLITRQEWNAARVEIENIMVTRRSNNWQIPLQLTQWLSLPEISNANQYTNVHDLYKIHSVEADTLLENTVKFCGIIWKINPEKKTAQFFVNENVSGGFNYEKLKLELSVGAFVEFSLVEIKNTDSSFWQVITARKSNDIVPIHLERHFSGVLKKVGSVGFVENVLIEPFLVRGKVGFLTGKAIRAYDANKRVWGWKAISIEDCVATV